MTVYKYAGFWRRLVAYIIDSTIVCFIFMILFTIAALAFFFGAISSNSKDFIADLTDPTRFFPIIISIWIFYFFINVAYFTYFHGATGRTPGKMLLGLQVVSADGTPVSFGIAFLRSVGYLISSAIFNLGFIWVGFDERKQGWHDKIADTVVIIREGENKTAGISIADSPTVLSEARQPMKQHEEIKGENNQADNMPENNG
jgi:uncharacterized RDD family membrane protein YckC